jgi:hypothetical protein
MEKIGDIHTWYHWCDNNYFKRIEEKYNTFLF